jgi:hypothetical protein
MICPCKSLDSIVSLLCASAAIIFSTENERKIAASMGGSGGLSVNWRNINGRVMGGHHGAHVDQWLPRPPQP